MAAINDAAGLAGGDVAAQVANVPNGLAACRHLSDMPQLMITVARFPPLLALIGAIVESDDAAAAATLLHQRGFPANVEPGGELLFCWLPLCAPGGRCLVLCGCVGGLACVLGRAAGACLAFARRLVASGGAVRCLCRSFGCLSVGGARPPGPCAPGGGGLPGCSALLFWAVVVCVVLAVCPRGFARCGRPSALVRSVSLCGVASWRFRLARVCPVGAPAWPVCAWLARCRLLLWALCLVASFGSGLRPFVVPSLSCRGSASGLCSPGPCVPCRGCALLVGAFLFLFLFLFVFFFGPRRLVSRGSGRCCCVFVWPLLACLPCVCVLGGCACCGCFSGLAACAAPVPVGGGGLPALLLFLSVFFLLTQLCGAGPLFAWLWTHVGTSCPCARGPRRSWPLGDSTPAGLRPAGYWRVAHLSRV